MTSTDLATLLISARIAGATALGMDLDGGSSLDSCVEHGAFGDTCYGTGWSRRAALDAIALDADLDVGALRESDDADVLLAAFAAGYADEAMRASESSAALA